MQFVKGPDFPTGAHDPRQERDQGRLHARVAAPSRSARGRRDRRGQARRAAHRRHRGAVPDLGRGDRAEDRRARQRPQDRGHPRRAQRVVGRHHATRHRAQARRQRARSCSTSSTSTRRCRRASRSTCSRSSTACRGCSTSTRRSSSTSSTRCEVVTPAHRVPAAQGPGARAHRRGPREGARHDRRDHRPHPRSADVDTARAGLMTKPFEFTEIQAQLHPRHAAAPAHPARGQEAARRAGRAPGDDQGARSRSSKSQTKLDGR